MNETFSEAVLRIARKLFSVYRQIISAVKPGVDAHFMKRVYDRLDKPAELYLFFPHHGR